MTEFGDSRFEVAEPVVARTYRISNLRYCPVKWRQPRWERWGGWAEVTIREWDGGGSLQIQSDWENFAYIWTSIGDQPLRAFLLDVEFSYFMKKAHHAKGKVFDAELSIKNLKADLLRERRSGDRSKERAREIYDALNELDIDGVVDAHEFGRAVYENSDLYTWMDSGDPCTYIDHPGCRAFWEGPWKAIKEHWLAELWKETAQRLSASQPAPAVASKYARQRQRSCAQETS